MPFSSCQRHRSRIANPDDELGSREYAAQIGDSNYIWRGFLDNCFRWTGAPRHPSRQQLGADVASFAFVVNRVKLHLPVKRKASWTAVRSLQWVDILKKLSLVLRNFCSCNSKGVIVLYKVVMRNGRTASMKPTNKYVSIWKLICVWFLDFYSFIFRDRYSYFPK